MFGLESISIDFSFSYFWLASGIVLAVLYSLFVYRFTIPKISGLKKSLLITLRILALVLIIVLIFDPVISLRFIENVNPQNLVFIDNSSSIINEDSTKNSDDINKLLSELENGNARNTFFSFDRDVAELDSDSSEKLDFKGSRTNFSTVINFLTNSEKNVSSALIISDGILNEGINPEYDAEKISFPIYTIGIGDTSLKKDIQLKNILHNNYIYLNAPTVISASVLNNGYPGKKVNAALFEGDKLIQQIPITLSNSGNNNIEFEYKPESAGEKKISIRVSSFEDEATQENNRAVFFVNVLNNKLKILMISGAPSADLKFIKTSLSSDENFEVSTITQLTSNEFLEGGDHTQKIDESDILFLIGFPVENSPNGLITEVKRAIAQEGKPFFILVQPSTSLKNLRTLSSELPFEFNNTDRGAIEVQPNIVEITNPLVNASTEEKLSSWNNLPPIPLLNAGFFAKPGSKIIVSAQARGYALNAPLILTRRLAKNSSIAFLAGDIWRWKLQTATKENSIFDSFISSAVKWLNVSDEQRQFNIETDKKLYTMREPVIFIAQVYDETFDPVNDAEVKVNITAEGEPVELVLNPQGNGIYSAQFETSKTGDFKYEASAKIKGNEVDKADGRFTIGDVDVEKITTRANFNLLNSISRATNGEFASIENYQNIISGINSDFETFNSEITINEEFNLLSDERLLFFIILLFGIEWFIRKKSGML